MLLYRERDIASPRFFLKTVQYWIKSYVLCFLEIHESCHAYLPGKSIITNAKCHIGKKFVANIDIENFFGNITRHHVFHLLIKNGVGEKLSGAVANLVTFEGGLPQGAPTSPEISNSLLYEFDNALKEFSEKIDLTYSRYADDITISGDSLSAVESTIRRCKVMLCNYGLKLKDSKTRIASRSASQRVTGVVVNKKLQPPREHQRRVRAMFHRAFLDPEKFVENLDVLRGHLSYLSAYEELKDSRHLRRYKMVLKKVAAMANKKKTNSNN